MIARALKGDANLQLAQANVRAARAGQFESGLQFIPSLNLSFRYTRLSEFTPVSLPFFDGARCVSSLADCQSNTQAYYQSLQLAPAILDQFALRGSISVGLSDIPLRLLRQYQAAGQTLEARRLDAQATAAQVAQGAGEAFYEYLRALGQLAVAGQSVDSAQRRRDDLQRSVAAGVVPRAELLRAEAMLTDLQRLRLLSQNSLGLARSPAAPAHPCRPDRAAGPRRSAGRGGDAGVRGRAAHPASAESAGRDSVGRTAGAGRGPQSLGAVGVAAAQPERFRQCRLRQPQLAFFPQTAEFRATWDLSLQLSFRPARPRSPPRPWRGSERSSKCPAGASAGGARRRRDRSPAQHSMALAAQAQIAVARAQLLAADENYRVRSSRAGQAAPPG